MSGILGALKQQGGSIDELARLPQAEIMNMAKNKLIRQDMLMPILSRKAEFNDAIARSNALKQGQANPAGQMPPSIIEQIMAKNAQAEAPTPMNMGIAANPIPERAYAEGGIVSFSGGGDVKHYDGQEESYVENGSYPGASEGSFGSWWNSQTYGSPENLLKRGQITPEQFKNIKARDVAASPVVPPVTPTVDTPQNRGIVDLSNSKGPAKPPSVPVVNAPNPYDEDRNALRDFLAESKKAIIGDKAELAAQKREAVNTRLLEAGLGILGGGSQYWNENVGKGAYGAAKGYGEDIKGIRAQEQGKAKELAALGLKGIELQNAISDSKAKAKYMQQHGNYFDLAGNAALSKAGTASGTGLPAASLLKIEDKFEAFATNPASDPALFAKLPPALQEKFTRFKPDNPVYKQGVQELQKFLPAIKQNYINGIRQNVAKQAPTFSGEF